MKKVISLLVIVCLIFSLGISSVAAKPPEGTQPIVWVDDDGPDDGINHFQSFGEGVANTMPGGTLYVAPGDYTGCSILYDITIIGDKTGEVSISGNNLIIPINLSASLNHFSISNCGIHNGSSDNISGSFTENDCDIFIDNCFITNASGAASGISLQAASCEMNVEITDSLIFSNNGYGIHISYIEDAWGTVSIDGNAIEENDGGISLEVGDTDADESDVTATIEQNQISNNGGGTTGINVTYMGEGYFDLGIYRNSLYNNGGDGIHVEREEHWDAYVLADYDYYFSVVIRDNWLESNHDDGIEYRESRYVPKYPNVYDNGELLFGVTLIDISGNDVYDNLGYGININERIILVDNKSESRLGINGGEHGSYSITKNVISGNGSDGIHIEEMNYWDICNNLITYNTGCSAAGISLDDSYCLVANNTIHFNQSHGIEVVGSLEYVLGQNGYYPFFLGEYINNIITLNGGYGFYVEGALPDALGANGEEPMPFQSNDVWGNDDGNYAPMMMDLTGMYGNISKDPRYVDEFDQHLSLDSPCVDAGWGGVLWLVTDDLDGVTRPMGSGIDMGCYELFVGSSFSPETFHPLVITQLANANATWTCLMEHLPDDPELMEEVEPMLEEVQAHMGNATSISNYIQANGELRQALSLMEEIDALCECECLN